MLLAENLVPIENLNHQRCLAGFRFRVEFGRIQFAGVLVGNLKDQSRKVFLVGKCLLASPFQFGNLALEDVETLLLAGIVENLFVKRVPVLIEVVLELVDLAGVSGKSHARGRIVLVDRNSGLVGLGNVFGKPLVRERIVLLVKRV